MWVKCRILHMWDNWKFLSKLDMLLAVCSLKDFSDIMSSVNPYLGDSKNHPYHTTGSILEL